MSRRTVDDIRVPLAVLFGVGVAVVFALQPVYLDAFAAVAMVLPPLAAVAGALRATESERPRSRRARAGIVAVVIVGAFVLPMIGLYGPVTTTVSGGVGEMMSSQEYREFYGPRYAPMGALAADDSWALFGGSYGGDAHEATVDIDLGQGLVGWSDVRFEAWLRDPVTDAVVAGAKAPIASAAIAPAGGSHARIDVGGFRDIGSYFMVVSGTSPRGERVILNGPVPRDAVFRGTFVDWLLAPSARP